MLVFALVIDLLLIAALFTYTKGTALNVGLILAIAWGAWILWSFWQRRTKQKI